MNNIAKLYVVGTPIGNFDDLSFRSLGSLKQVSLIAADDYKNTVKLMRHFDSQNNYVKLRVTDVGRYSVRYWEDKRLI